MKKNKRINVRDVGKILFFTTKLYFFIICKMKATKKITSSKIIDMIIILLKWYKNETLLVNKINNIGDNIEEIKTIKKIFKFPRFLEKFFCKKYTIKG